MIPYNIFLTVIVDFAEEQGFEVNYYQPNLPEDEEIFINISFGNTSLLRFFTEHTNFSYNKNFRYKRLYKFTMKKEVESSEIIKWCKWLEDKKIEYKQYQQDLQLEEIKKDFKRTKKKNYEEIS